MYFRRITDNHLTKGSSLRTIYDEIRMRDADIYPKTFIEYGDIVFEFSRASLRKDCIYADVKISKKK